MLPTTSSLVLALAISSGAAAQSPPSDVAVLASRAGLGRALVSSCAGEFRMGQDGAFAVALSHAADSGRYLILEADATVTELAGFVGGADLSCHSRAEAEALGVSISESETVQGQVTPRFETTVVCGFVTGTEAVCWQYSPTDRAFVRVGGWIT